MLWLIICLDIAVKKENLFQIVALIIGLTNISFSCDKFDENNVHN